MRKIAAGVDIGATKIAVAYFDCERNAFLTETLREFPSRVQEGPAAVVGAVRNALEVVGTEVGVALAEVPVMGLDYPGPARRDGQLSAKGSTNYSDPAWRNYNLRDAVERDLGIRTGYFNDGDVTIKYAHDVYFGPGKGMDKCSVGFSVGSGLGGGVIYNGEMVLGARGFGTELGHLLLPWQDALPPGAPAPQCNCGRPGDLESIASLTGIRKNLMGYFTQQFPDHPLAKIDIHTAAFQLKRYDPRTDGLSAAIFGAQAKAIGLAFDIMVNTLDPDVLFLGGGLFENSPDFVDWFFTRVKDQLFRSPYCREEQSEIPVLLIPDVDMAASRGCALWAADRIRLA